MDSASIDQPQANVVRRFWSWANHDFCPGQNRWAYKLKHPLAVVILSAILATFCGYVINPLAYVVAGVLWLVVVVGLSWPAIAVRGVTVSVIWGKTRTHAGDVATVRVRATNHLPIPVFGLELTSLVGVGDAVLPKLKARESTEIEWLATTTQRGVFPKQDGEVPTLETSLPFGVWTSHRPISFEGRLTVWPAKTDLYGRLDVGESRSGEDRLTDRRAGDAGDLLGVRRYRLGDSLRRVHWPQTARQRELIICERQASVSSVVRVGVDLPNKADALERSLNACASVVAALTQSGTSVAVYIGGEESSITSDPRQIYDHLATIELPERPIPSVADVDVRISSEGARTAKGTHIALTDTDWEPAVRNAWRRACGVA